SEFGGIGRQSEEAAVLGTGSMMSRRHTLEVAVAASLCRRTPNYQTLKRLLPPARSTGKDFGAKARRSIFPRVATRARRSSSGAWFYRNISPPFSVQAQCRRRKPD